MYTSKNILITRPRRCYACDRKFPEGTEMIYWRNLTGDYDSGHTCLTCDELKEQMEHERYDFPSDWVKELLGPNETPEEYLDKYVKEKYKDL